MKKSGLLLVFSGLVIVASPFICATIDSDFVDAVKHNNFKAAQKLLLAGANINKSDTDNWTLLHHVVCFTQSPKAAKKQVDFLITHGAKVKLRENIHGETAFEMAAAQSKIPLVTLFLTRSGPRITATNKYGKLALRRAFYDDNLELLTLLEKHGAVVTNRMAAWARVNLKYKIADFLEYLMAKQQIRPWVRNLGDNLPKKRKRKSVPHRSVKREIRSKSTVEKFKP